MKDSLTISVTNVKKSYQFSVSNQTYRIAKASLLVIALIILALSYWGYNSNSSLEQTKEQLNLLLVTAEQQAYSQKETNQTLKAQLDDQKKQWHQQYNRLTQILTSINSIQINSQVATLKEKFIFSAATLSPSEVEKMLKVIPSGYPIQQKTRISSHYGKRLHPIRKQWHMHKGTDFTASVGVPLYATADGVVKYSGNQTGFGKTLVIQHQYGFETLFAHLSQLKAPKGAKVVKGQLVGFSGRSGNVTAPHLHYEILFNKQHLDPRYFIKWKKRNYQSIFTKIRTVPWQFLTNLIKIQHIQEKALSQTDALSVEK